VDYSAGVSSHKWESSTTALRASHNVPNTRWLPPVFLVAFMIHTEGPTMQRTDIDDTQPYGQELPTWRYHVNNTQLSRDISQLTPLSYLA